MGKRGKGEMVAVQSTQKWNVFLVSYSIDGYIVVEFEKQIQHHEVQR